MSTIDDLVGDLWITPFDRDDEVERAAADRGLSVLSEAIRGEGESAGDDHPARRGESVRPRSRIRGHVTSGTVSRTKRRSVFLVPVAVLAAAVVAILLITSASPTTAPAYALTRHPNGSITITLSDLTIGIPASNARLQALGIDETVIPIRVGCDSPNGSGIVMHPDPHFEYSGSVSVTITARSAAREPKGYDFHHVLAAMRLPNGRILAFIGALEPPIPTCLPFSSTPSDSNSVLSTP